MQPVPDLVLSHFQFEFHFSGANTLPPYAGSAWRGAFGHALKQTVCVIQRTACADCLLRTSCAYPYIFETPPPPNSEKMRLYEAAPHPFVIRPSASAQTLPGQAHIGLTLFGNGHRYLPYFIHAFAKAGAAGLGKARQAFELASVRQVMPSDNNSGAIYQDGRLQQPLSPIVPAIPSCPETVTFTLLTPLRIKQDGKYVGADRFNFGAFFGNLQRRISLLSYFHSDTALDTDFKALGQAAKTITISRQQIAWQDWTRYSSRQQTTMQMGGLLGEFTISGDLQPFWPYLWLGQWTHVGKGTSMGLGQYRIKAASLPAFTD